MVRILEKTKSVCPVCLKPVDAFKVEREDGIYLDKQCEEHGMFRVLIWNGDRASYQAWDHPAPVSTPTVCQTEVKDGCPYDCGLCPDHEQQICCVVFEITQRCNLGCPVCFASAGKTPVEDPSQEEIAGWYDRLLEVGGPYNIQLSGGEPTMKRKGIFVFPAELQRHSAGPGAGAGGSIGGCRIKLCLFTVRRCDRSAVPGSAGTAPAGAEKEGH